jgi:hypothetical protein
MQSIINNNMHTSWKTKDQAKRVCDANSAEDPEWTYKVVPLRERFVVEVFDETGFSLGYL